MTPEPLVVAGLGQLGTLFAEGFLRLGHPVVPLLRSSNLDDYAALEPRLSLLAVGEDDWRPLARSLSGSLGRRVALVANELRACDLEGLDEPTVMVVWFERKRGGLPKEVRPSVVSGPASDLLRRALLPWSLRVDEVARDDLGLALAIKNLYILGLNLGGLSFPEANAGALLLEHRATLEPLLDELCAIEERGTTSGAWSRDAAVAGFEAALAADPRHGALGRTAPRRLERTLALARRWALPSPTLEALWAKHGSGRDPV